jgi:hypothetical protein
MPWSFYDAGFSRNKTDKNHKKTIFRPGTVMPGRKNAPSGIFNHEDYKRRDGWAEQPPGGNPTVFDMPLCFTSWAATLDIV